MSEWELSKENVQPVRQGRKMASLNAALETSSSDHTLALKKEKHEFETELRTYSGDDPLEVWYNYILWTEQAFPKGGTDSHMTKILERCINQFIKEPKYKNDPRYIDVWIRYANYCIDPNEIFNFMFDQEMGCQLSCFYESWAWSLEQVGNTKKTDAIFLHGIKCNAQPIDHLRRKHEEFQKRVARGLVGVREEEEEKQEVEERTALGQLKSRGKKHQVSNTRIGAAKQVKREFISEIVAGKDDRVASRGGLGLAQQISRPQVGQTFQIYSEQENIHPASLPSQAGEWSQPPKRDTTNKENEKAPGVWTKAKVPQRGASLLAAQRQPTFTVHVEENADQAMMTPRKMPEVGNQVLSSRKPEKQADPLRNVCQPGANSGEVVQRPMYCKDKVYGGEEEFSFEEIRAAKVKLKKKKEEEELRMEQERREIEAQKEVLRHNRELLSRQAEELRQKQLELKREQEAMIEQCRQQVQIQHEQFNTERKRQMQLQQEQLERDIQNRMMQQLNLGTHLSGKAGDQMSSMRQTNDTSLQSGISPSSFNSQNDASLCKALSAAYPSSNSPPNVKVTHPSNDSEVRLQSSIDSTDHSVFRSGHMGTSIGGNGSHVSEEIHHSLNSSSVSRTPSNGSILHNSQSAGKFSGPTPDSGRKSLTAPSPTVNTREAMHIVRGMFNASLEIDKHMGWGGEDVEMAAGVQEPVTKSEVIPSTTSAPFTVFDENAATSNAPLQIHQDQENDENRFARKPVVETKKKGLRGILKTVEAEGTDAVSTKNTGQTQDYPMDHDYEEKTERIESQARDDYTIAPVGSHLSFAAAARCASTPYHHGNNSINSIPDVSQIQPDKTRESFYASEVTDVKNLSPIMEGSNEDSSGPNTNSNAGSMSSISHNGHHTSKMNVHSSTSKTPFPIYDENEENGPVAMSEHEECNQSHIIDTSLYVPPILDQEAENKLHMSIRIDPQNPFDEDAIKEFLERLPKPLQFYPNYVSEFEKISSLKPGFIATLGSMIYNIQKMIGKGGYAQVFSATPVTMSMDLDMSIGDETLDDSKEMWALKVQKPPCPWEFYICCEIQERLSKLKFPVDTRPAMMAIEKGYFYSDASCLVNKYYNQGTLLDFINLHTKDSTVMDEAIAMYITIELLHMIEKLHKCQIIHGDVKPDNFLIRDLPNLPNSTSPQDVFGGDRRPLVLIDFGQSIDMTMYPPGTTFMAKVTTNSFQCIEMQTDRPWTYQTDLFGMVGTVHVVLFRQYMNVYQEKGTGTWRITQSINRKWNQPLWKKLFIQMLNVPSCDEIPELSVIRREFEQYFVENLLQTYNKNIAYIKQNIS